jgi:hypothetical protein
MRLRHACIPALSVLALASGCRESLSPPGLVGTYVLQRVGDAPIPAVIFAAGGTTVRVIADTLVLGMNNRGRFVSIQTIEAQAGPGAPTRIAARLTYSVVRVQEAPADRVTSRVEVHLHFECPPNALCAAGPHLVAWREDPWLVVQETFTPTDAPRYYKRISPFPDR